MGRRFRFQVSPVTGTYHWVEYLADYRRYDPLIFNYLTLATRALHRPFHRQGRNRVPEVHRASRLRARLRSEQHVLPVLPGRRRKPDQLQRRAAAGKSRRRRQRRASLPADSPPRVGIPPWRVCRRSTDFSSTTPDSLGRAVNRFRFRGRPATMSPRTAYPLRSYGFGLRLNLFNYAILRWDYAIPVDQDGHKGLWTWSLWPSF